MPIYSFFRFEENQDPRWKGGASKRWVFKFKIETGFLNEDELVEEVQAAINEEGYEPGTWKVTESFGGGGTWMTWGPFEL